MVHLHATCHQAQRLQVKSLNMNKVAAERYSYVDTKLFGIIENGTQHKVEMSTLLN